MPADPSDLDPKTLWKELDPETDPVTLDKIHRSARKLDLAARLTLFLIPLYLVAFAFFIGIEWPMARDPWLKTAMVLMALGVLLSGGISLRMQVLPRAPGEPAALYLRRRLQQALVSTRDGWRLFVLPLAPGVLLAIFVAYRGGQAPWWAALLAVAMLTAAFAFVLWLSSAATPKLRAQLRELDELLRR
jgi:hypothetical protein